MIRGSQLWPGRGVAEGGDERMIPIPWQMIHFVSFCPTLFIRLYQHINDSHNENIVKKRRLVYGESGSQPIRQMINLFC